MPRAKDPDKLVTIALRLPPAVVAELDKVRGEASRAEFLRGLIVRRFDPAARPQAPKPSGSPAKASAGILPARRLERREVTPIPKGGKR